MSASARAVQGSGAPQDHEARWPWLAALALFTAGLCWAAFSTRRLLLSLGLDTWVHLAYVRRTLEYGIFPGDAFYAGLPTPPYYSLGHVLFAAASALTRIPPHELWLASPPFLVAAAIAAEFAWLRALTGDGRVAAAGAAARLLVQAPDPIWWVMPYPRGLALTAFSLSLFFCARAERRSSFLLAAALALGVCLDLHLFVGGVCLLAVVFFEIAASASFVRAWRRILAIGAGGMLVAAPWILNILARWRERDAFASDYLRTDPSAWTLSLGPITIQGYGLRRLFDLFPWALWIPVALGLAFAIRRWASGKATTADRYALVTTAGTVFLLLPPVYGWLVHLGGVWTGRVSQVIPLPLFVGLGAVGVFDSLRAARLAPVTRLLAAGMALALAAAIAAATAGTVHRFALGAAMVTGYVGRGGPLRNWDLSKQVAQTGPQPRVILSDPSTSYALPYYLGSFVVNIPATHSAFVDQRAREFAVRRVFRDTTPMDKIFKTLDTYHVDAVLIARSSPWSGRRTGGALLRRLRGSPEFEDTGCCGDLVLLRYRPHRRLK